MKFAIVMTLAAILLLPFSNNVFAQEEDDWLRIPYRVTLSVDAGIGMPLQPSAFNDLWNSALPATFSVGILTIPQIEIKGWVTYASWGISGIPAQNEIGIEGVHEVTGGTITTVVYGASAKYIPLINSRITPTAEIGGGFFQATAEDLVVGAEQTNSMPDADGPAFLLAVGMDYGINETWSTYIKFNYVIGFSDTFAPGDLVRGVNDPPVEGSDLHFAAIVLGITLKI